MLPTVAPLLSSLSGRVSLIATKLALLTPRFLMCAVVWRITKTGARTLLLMTLVEITTSVCLTIHVAAYTDWVLLITILYHSVDSSAVSLPPTTPLTSAVLRVLLTLTMSLCWMTRTSSSLARTPLVDTRTVSCRLVI